METKNFIALSCSGASDLGELTDRATRILRKKMEGVSMNCLAKIGFAQKALVDELKENTALLIDGCPIDCAKNSLEANGITNYKHVRLTDFGLRKGESPVNDENIQFVLEKIKACI